MRRPWDGRGTSADVGVHNMSSGPPGADLVAGPAAGPSSSIFGQTESQARRVWRHGERSRSPATGRCSAQRPRGGPSRRLDASGPGHAPAEHSHGRPGHAHLHIRNASRGRDAKGDVGPFQTARPPRTSPKRLSAWTSGPEFTDCKRRPRRSRRERTTQDRGASPDAPPADRGRHGVLTKPCRQCQAAAESEP